MRFVILLTLFWAGITSSRHLNFAIAIRQEQGKPLFCMILFSTFVLQDCFTDDPVPQTCSNSNSHLVSAIDSCSPRQIVWICVLLFFASCFLLIQTSFHWFQIFKDLFLTSNKKQYDNVVFKLPQTCVKMRSVDIFTSFLFTSSTVLVKKYATIASPNFPLHFHFGFFHRIFTFQSWNTVGHHTSRNNIQSVRTFRSHPIHTKTASLAREAHNALQRILVRSWRHAAVETWSVRSTPH